MMDAFVNPEQPVVLLDSDVSGPIFSMPPPSYLLHPPSDEEMAQERELLYDNALRLAGRMTDTHFTSKILEALLEEAFRVLESDELPPGPKNKGAQVEERLSTPRKKA